MLLKIIKVNVFSCCEKQKESVKYRLNQQTFALSKSTIKTLNKGVNMFKVNNKDTEKRQLRRSGVFIVNFEHISNLFLEFLLLPLNK